MPPEGTTELGIDIVSVPRITAALARHGDRFPRRILTDAEAAYVRNRPETLAGRVLAACARRSSELVAPRSVSLIAGLIEWFPDAGRRLLRRLTTRG